MADSVQMMRHYSIFFAAANLTHRQLLPSSSRQTLEVILGRILDRILWAFRIQTDKMVTANQPGTVVVRKQQKRAAVIDVAISSHTSIRKKEHEKLEG